jgi:hypothetical protein
VAVTGIGVRMGSIGRQGRITDPRDELPLPVLVRHAVIPGTEDNAGSASQLSYGDAPLWVAFCYGKPEAGNHTTGNSVPSGRLPHTDTRVVASHRAAQPGECAGFRVSLSLHTMNRGETTGHVSFPGKRRRALLDRKEEEEATRPRCSCGFTAAAARYRPKKKNPETNGAVRRRSAARRAHGARVPARARSNRPAPTRWTWSGVGWDAGRSETGKRRSWPGSGLAGRARGRARTGVNQPNRRPCRALVAWPSSVGVRVQGHRTRTAHAGRFDSASRGYVSGISRKL